jgi:hypothetical protein
VIVMSLNRHSPLVRRNGIPRFGGSLMEVPRISKRSSGDASGRVGQRLIVATYSDGDGAIPPEATTHVVHFATAAADARSG